MFTQLPEVHRPSARHHVGLISVFNACSSNQMSDETFNEGLTKEAHTPSTAPPSHTLLLLLDQSREGDKAVIGASLRLCHLTAVFSWERGGQQRKTRLQLKGRALVLTLHYPLLAVVRDGNRRVGEAETRCRQGKPFSSNKPVNSIPGVCHTITPAVIDQGSPNFFFSGGHIIAPDCDGGPGSGRPGRPKWPPAGLIV